MDFPNGPWNKTAVAQWAGHPVTIYQNAEKILLMLVFDEADDKSVKGLLVLMKKPFLVEGSPDAFAEAQSRSLVVVQKVSREAKRTFLLVEATPAYIEYSQAKLFDSVRAGCDELEALGKIVADIASVHGTKATELRRVPPEIGDALTGDPLLLFLMPASGVAAGAPTEAAKIMLLGTDADGKAVETSTVLLKRAAIAGSGQKQAQALQVLCENALLAETPCIIIDSYGTLGGMGERNAEPDCKRFCEANDLQPQGFALSKALFGADFSIDLTVVSASAFAKTFRLTDEIRQALPALMPPTLQDAAEQARGGRAVRAMRVLQKQYSSLFGRAAISPPAAGGIYVNLSRQPGEVRTLAIISLLNSLQNGNAFVAMNEDLAGAPDELKGAIAALENRGFSYACCAAHPSDLSFVKDPTLAIEAVGEETIATIHGEKRRFILRPTLSKKSA
ncbi:hypothetical protein COT29_01730 [Candidatus Micrarchaeota archaeon CG08_land_8_20_14_0_20_59_11]|nr:MAG: hypothetical protein COT29_01730 [Candidatus Micrarchaeota archaeon CG08_land_8_20_14_0_20_59_11]